jgi:hypothetical protein
VLKSHCFVEEIKNLKVGEGDVMGSVDAVSFLQQPQLKK